MKLINHDESDTSNLNNDQLVLSRKMSFYIVTYYLPSGLFVVVSWISFLVNPEVIILEKVDRLLESFSFAKQSTLAGDPGPNDSTDHNFPCPDQHIQHHPD